MDLLHISPPCQDFSGLNQHTDYPRATRNLLPLIDKVGSFYMRVLFSSASKLRALPVVHAVSRPNRSLPHQLEHVFRCRMALLHHFIGKSPKAFARLQYNFQNALQRCTRLSHPWVSLGGPKSHVCMQQQCELMCVYLVHVESMHIIKMCQPRFVTMEEVANMLIKSMPEQMPQQKGMRQGPRVQSRFDDCLSQ